MIPAVRKHYNQQFTPQKYQSFLEDLHKVYPGAIGFRVAETPVFVPAALTEKIIRACEEVINVIVRPDFKTLTRAAIPPNLQVPGEDRHPHFISIDFAVCRDENGSLEPQLIELQGFPTMFAFQSLLAAKYREHFQIPGNLSNYLNGYTDNSYFDLLRRMIRGKYPPENTILLEVKPHEQKTRVDFYHTQAITGVQPVCITELVKEGNKLFYFRNGEKTEVKRIYNRLIFEDLERQRKSLGKFADLTQEIEVEWVSHPNWFYRISKFMIPLIESAFVPKTYFLHKLQVLPQDLENYVLKPLFSFAGQGVIIDLTRKDIDAIADPHNWILQRKVQYEEAIRTPGVPAKCEIRMMYFWEEDIPRPLLVHNLCRLSKGKMIGVSYNADKDWVGGSVCFFEQ